MGPFDIGGLQVLSALQNIAPPPQDPFGSMGLIPQQQPFNMQDRMNELYQPSMTMQNRFNQQLDLMPQLGDYQPSMLRKIGAALYGMSQQDPFGAAMKYNLAPYTMAFEQWKAPLNNLQQAADNERLMNAQNRQWAQNVVTQEMNTRKQDEVERRNAALEADRERLRDRQDRMQKLRELMYTNPNMQMREVNGRAYAFDPATGQMIDTGIAGMTDMEKAQFTATAAMQRAQYNQGQQNQRTQFTQEQQNFRDTNNWLPFNRVITNPDGTQGMEAVMVNPVTNEVRPMQGGGTLQRPSAPSSDNILTRPITTAAMTARARQAVSEHPEWAPYIKFTSSGQFERVDSFPASAGLFGFGARPGSDPAIVKQINDYIFGGNRGGTTAGNTVPGNQQPNQSANTPVVPSQRVRVRAPNGSTGTIPANQLQQAIAAGYTQVQ